MFLLTLKRDKERGREREKSIDVREKPFGCLPQTLGPGIEPATWVCALAGNATGDPSVLRTTPKQLSCTSQGCVHS